MKAKHFLMTIALLLATTLAAMGQTVDYTIDGTQTTNVAISNFDVHSLSAATAITLKGKWTTADISKLRNALVLNTDKNASLLTADLSAMTFNTDGYSLGRLFADCAELTEVKMPTDASAASISALTSTFANCVNLTGTVDLSAFTGAKNFTRVFSNCPKLTGVKMPATYTNTGTDAATFNYAFSGCAALEGTIDLSPYTDVKDFTYSFSGCAKLTGVKMPATNTSTNNETVSFSSTFSGCAALEGTVDLSAFTNASSFDSTFKGCAKLTAVKMPATNTSTSTNSVSFFETFNGCRELTGTIDLSAFTNVTSSFTRAFKGCAMLTAVKLGTVPSTVANTAFTDANPNCLKYLPASTAAVPANWSSFTNFIADGKALTNIKVEDGNPFHCPESFTMDSHTISYTRTLTKDKWATICLPFDALIPADCIAKALTGGTEGSVSFTQVNNAISPNAPYIIAYTGSKATQTVTFTQQTSGATIAVTPDKLETAPAGATYKMAGTYADLTGQSMYLLDDNSFLLYNAGNLHPFHAYITASDGTPNLAPRLAIGNDGGATLIDRNALPEAEAGTIPALSRVCTIDGRLVKPVPAAAYSTLKDGLAKGIYIVNGKKIAITE